MSFAFLSFALGQADAPSPANMEPQATDAARGLRGRPAERHPLWTPTALTVASVGAVPLGWTS